MISFRAADFTRVFSIPGHVQGGRKINKPKKLSQEVKARLVQIVCGKRRKAKNEALMDTSKGKGLKKSDILEGHWRCLMDLVKNRLTRSSRASNISFP